MAVEIEIDPFGRAAALAAAKHAAVKGARGGEIVDRKGEMERADRIGHRVPALSHPPPLGESIAEPDRRAARIAAMMTHPKPCRRSEEHTSELQSLMRISYAVFCLKKKKKKTIKTLKPHHRA